jgi:dTDP-4-amino-4,6-dideoxygalactose transaminase
MDVPFVNLALQFKALEKELTQEFCRVGYSGNYVMGPEVVEFEAALAKLCNVKQAISVGNGTDALELILQAYGIGDGDEVITAPNSFIASAGAIAAVGATPIFVDVGEDYNIDVSLISNAITEKTKAIIPVHLTGNPADMDAINVIAAQYGLKVIEDAAQAIGAEYKGRPVGCLSDAAAFSLHPLKNFHLLGDAGFISTNDENLAAHIRKIKNHGLINRDESATWGRNSRLDSMQAAFGLIKLKHLSNWTARFQEIADIYLNELDGIVNLPVSPKVNSAVYHNFVIRVEDRTKLMSYLGDNNIGCKIHYPIPLHLMGCSKELGYKKGSFPVTEKQAGSILSLPIYPELANEQVLYVSQKIREFYSE